MILSWCLITKGDEELDSLKRAIDSVYEYVDEVILVANGKEIEQTRSYYNKLDKVKFFNHPWTKDFAEQRNFAASQIRKDADFYGWMDSDDVVVGAHLLRDLATTALYSDYDTVFFTYWYSAKFNGVPSEETMEEVELTQMRERLIKPGSLVWKKRIHETPVPVDNLEDKYSQVKYSEDFPIAWLHLGAHRELPEDKQLERMNRNQELLELELEDERKQGEADPRTLLYLMKIYAEKNDPELLQKNLEMGNEYLTKSGWDAERATCCALMARSLGKLGRVQESKEFLHKSIKEYPFDPLLYLYLSQACFNLKKYNEMYHWLKLALSMDTEGAAGSMNNILEMKTLSTELLMRYYLNGERNVRKAYKSAALLYKLVPTENNLNNLDFLEGLKDLDMASEEAHKLMLFYETQENSKGVVSIFESMPENMKSLPFAWHMYNKHKTPRTWAENEICYYATFGREHFEKWSPLSLTKGLGGSETAVIRLSQEWAKLGYKVTVYCDCGLKEGVYDGVNYVQYYKFNPRDNFNIFINWRSGHLAGRIKAKKFVIDLHDLFADVEYRDHKKYDKLFVKSKYHRSLAPSVSDNKINIISNGI